MDSFGFETSEKRFHRTLAKLERKNKDKEIYAPLVFDEPAENFWTAQHDAENPVMYTVNNYESFVRRYKDVMISRDHVTTIRRRYELFCELSKGKFKTKGNWIYELKNRMPIYAKRKNAQFLEDLEVLYKMRLLHIFSEERFNEYIEALKIVFNERRTT